MATATGYLELNIKGFESAISSAKKALAGLAVAFVSFKTVQWFKEGVEGAIEFGNEMYQASMRMGQFDPGQLLIAQKTLERMGLDAGQARDQMGELIKTGRPLSTLFKSSSDFAANMNRSKRDFGAQAAALSKSAKDLNAAYYTIHSIKEQTKTFFLSAVSGFIKPLRGVLDMLNKVDVAKFGKEFGEKIGKGISILTGALNNGTLGEILIGTIKLGFMEAVNWLWSGLQSLAGNAGKWFSDAWKASVEYLRNLLVGLFSNDFFSAIVNKFSAMWDLIAAQIAETFGADSTAAEYRQSAVEADNKALDAWKKIADTLPSFSLSGGSPFDTSALTADLQDKIAAALLKASGSGQDNTPEGFREGLGKQEPYKVIADSLASVGGGGGFARQGMSIQERQHAAQQKAAKEMTDQQKKTNTLLERGFSGLGGDFKPGKDREFTGMTKQPAGIKTTSGLSKGKQGINMKR